MSDDTEDLNPLGVFTDRDFVDIKIRDDKVRECTTREGDVFYNPVGTERYFASLKAAKMSARMLNYWLDVRAGKRTRDDARIGMVQAKRRRKSRKSRFGYESRAVPPEMAFNAYMIPKTAGPVFDYIRNSMAKFGVGTFEPPKNTKVGRELVANEVKDIYQKTLIILRELYGDNWPVLIRSVGLSHEVIQYLEDPDEWLKTRKSGKMKAFASAELGAALRQILMVNLIHIYNVTEELRDMERQVWVLLQRSHDVRLVPSRFKVPLQPDTDDPSAIKAWKERRKNAGLWATSMRDVVSEDGFIESLLMPLRARALVNYPDLEYDQALKVERSKIRPDYVSPPTRGFPTSTLAYWQKRDDSMSEAMMAERDRLKRLAESDPGFTVEDAEKFWEAAGKVWMNFRRSVSGNPNAKKKPPRNKAVADARRAMWSDILEYIETLRWERQRLRREEAEDGKDIPDKRD